MCVLKEIAIIWTNFNFLQCLFGLIRSAFKAYNPNSLLSPNITLAKVTTSGFFGVFSQSIFNVLQSDTTTFEQPSPKKGRKHSVDSNTLYSQDELNLLKREFRNF